MFLFMIDWNDFFENDFSPKLIYVVRGIKGVWDASCFLYFEPRTKRKKSNFICSTWWIMWPGFLWLVYGETVYRSNRKVSKYFFKLIFIEGIVVAIWSDSPFIEWHVWFTAVSLKNVNDQEWMINIRIYLWKFIFKFFSISVKYDLIWFWLFCINS